MKKTICCIYALAMMIAVLSSVSHLTQAQSISIEDYLKLLHHKKEKRPLSYYFKMSGQIQSNIIFNTGGSLDNRLPIDYNINGSIQMSILNVIQLPFSFFISRLGKGYQYPTPPTRLSLHPTYKWIKAHIGVVSMTFSPYSLNGLEFIGGGVEVNPYAPIEVSVMGGVLQKAIPYTATNNTAYFKRIGYGSKFQYKQEYYHVCFILWGAHDQFNSIPPPPDSISLLPKKNFIISGVGGFSISKRVTIDVEYSLSIFTHNLLDSNRADNKGQLVNWLIKPTTSTNYYQAIKARSNFQTKKATFGMSYERIDPNYQSLGSYFFSGDLESISLDYGTSIFKKNQGHLQVQIGYQRDNLHASNPSTNRRLVGSINCSYRFNKKLQMTYYYSNYNSFIALKSTTINLNMPTLDTTQYTQVSQQANVTLSYTLSGTAKSYRIIQAVVTYQDVLNLKNKQKENLSSSRFYNWMISYNHQIIPWSLNIQSSLNGVISQMASLTQLQIGPQISCNTQLYKGQISLGGSTSYLGSIDNQAKTYTFINNMQANYVFHKKHVFSLALIQQIQRYEAHFFQNVVGTMSYSYHWP
ncbi:MAG: hypothetical protein QM528_08165 [Phycisphaerales bacterium]|nr:hypothetical protein [Phycisphaerales bacterium]